MILSFFIEEKLTLQMAMDSLKEYEKISGQMSNKDKSCFYVFHKTVETIVQEIKDINGFSKEKFPLIYLGYPIGHVRKRKIILLK